MTLKLGTITTIVISSPQLAKQVLHENSQIFSNRTVPHALCALDHDKVSVGLLPTLALWKKLRKICATKLFSTKMLDSRKILRQQKLQELLDYVNEKCNKEEVFDIDPQRVQARMASHMKKVYKIFYGIIEERISSRDSKADYEVCNDVLDSLLHSNNLGETTSELSRNEMIHLFQYCVFDDSL
ncbi:unspecific monooxygenase [Trifolium repens]|nr:unspecific monooxygenase [Trifolium repens]